MSPLHFGSSNPQARLPTPDPTRSFHVVFGDVKVTIDASGPAAIAAVQFAVRNLPTSSSGIESKRLMVQAPGDLDKGAIIEELMREITFQLIDRSSAGAHIHAAVLGQREQGLLLVGASGSGKSTLTAWLVSKGFQLLSDELAYIALGDTRVAGLTRPIHLKERFGFVQREIHGEHIIACGAGELVHPEGLGGSVGPSSLPIHAIVFPCWSPNGEASLERLSGATTTRLLMEALVNARNLSGHGFAEMARLARAIPGYRMSYCTSEEAEGLVRKVSGASGSEFCKT